MVCALNETDSVSKSHDRAFNLFRGVGKSPRERHAEQKEKIRNELGAMLVNH